ncbi:MAG: iron-sulfur cluster assembly protein [Candidatus Thermoplasmatota archaeon]|nr:iron-sulfur cluster assembly protein [Candidatus Thermoplasmatota archaeon]
MTEDISEKEILILLDKVKHPAINCTLCELGIIKDVSIKEGKVLIAMSLLRYNPFSGFLGLKLV